jgi:O-antigen/teichoic acid export membrane protein
MRKLAVNGLKWSIMQQVVTQLINYISVIVLAALVDPAAQGFITIASIPIGFVGVLGSFGVREKIIKEKQINAEYRSCLLGFIIVISGLLFVLSILLTFIVAWFYQDNFPLRVVIKYGLLISLITPFGVYNHYFESFQTRDINFRGISIVNALSMLMGISISVYVAYIGYGYLGLSLKMILPHFFNLILYIVVFKPSLQVHWCPDMYKEFKNFSMFLTFNNIANYFVRNIDYLIIGKVFNADILGQYSIAYKILLFPMKNVTSRIQAVAMPLLAKLDAGSENFNKKYFMIIGLLSFITLPMMGLIALTAPDWVPLTFNYKYNLLVQMIMILSAVGAFQSLVSPVGVLYLLKESTKLMFYNSIAISIVISVAFLVSSLTHQINIVLITYAVIWIVFVLPISMYRIYNVYNMKLSTFLITMFPAFLCVTISIIIVFLCRTYLFNFVPIVNILFSAILFSGLFLLFYRLIMKKEENSIYYYHQILRGK